jgi:hypothetical protein
MRATTVGRVSLVGLTTIGVLVSQVNGAQAFSVEPDSSTTYTQMYSEVKELANGSVEYNYKLKFTGSKGQFTSWILPLLDTGDLVSIQNDLLSPGQLSGKTWNLYQPDSKEYRDLWTSQAEKIDAAGKGKFSDSPWILAFTAGLNVDNNQALFQLVSRNAARNVPFIAELRDVVGSGYSYEAGDPPAPGSVPQAPTPFLGFGLAAIAAKTATRKRTV